MLPPQCCWFSARCRVKALKTSTMIHWTKASVDGGAGEGQAIPQSGRCKKACENAMGSGEGQNIQIFDWESWCPKLQEWGQAIHWAAANGRLEMVFGHSKGCWDQETDHLGLESEYHLRDLRDMICPKNLPKKMYTVNLNYYQWNMDLIKKGLKFLKMNLFLSRSFLQAGIISYPWELRSLIPMPLDCRGEAWRDSLELAFLKGVIWMSWCVWKFGDPPTPSNGPFLVGNQWNLRVPNFEICLEMFREVSEDMIAFYPVHFKMLSNTSIDIHLTHIYILSYIHTLVLSIFCPVWHDIHSFQTFLFYHLDDATPS